MIRIGEFVEHGDSYMGRLTMLGLEARLTIVPTARSEVQNAPDYRVHAGETADGPEIGAAWKRTGERAGAYLAMVIDDPQFARPVRANLFRPAAKGQPHLLIWQRNQPRRETGQQ